jgi:hypothetical protein
LSGHSCNPPSFLPAGGILIWRADAAQRGKPRGVTRSRQLLAPCARSTSTYCAARNAATHAVRLLPLRSWLAQPTLTLKQLSLAEIRHSSGHPRIPPGWKHRPGRPGCQRCSVPIACDISRSLISCLLAPALAVHRLGYCHQHAGRLAAFHGNRSQLTLPVPACLRGVFWVYPRVPWHMDFRPQTLPHRTSDLQQTRLGRVCVASPPPPLRPCPRWTTRQCLSSSGLLPLAGLMGPAFPCGFSVLHRHITNTIF